MDGSDGSSNLIIENVSATGGLTGGIQYDVVRTHYDVPDNSHGLGGQGYIQDEYNLSGKVSYTEKYSSVTNNTGGTLISQTWYNYDEEGNVVWAIKNIVGLGYKTEDYAYDALNRPVQVTFQKNNSSEIFVHIYDYDPVNGQLWHVFIVPPGNHGTKVLQATYVYNLDGSLKRTELGDHLQGTDYTYTLQGALKAINNSDKNADPGQDDPSTNGFMPDAFGEVLDYFDNDYVNPRNYISPINNVDASSIVSTDNYNGTLKAMTWFSKKPSSVISTYGSGVEDPTTNIFQYDDHYRFVENTWGTNINFSGSTGSFNQANSLGSNSKEILRDPNNWNNGAYDANGNIQSLQRNDVNGNTTDQFTYNYTANTNQLESVSNGVTGNNYASYLYDELGQLTTETATDPSDKTKYIQYDGAGRVLRVAADASFIHLMVEYVYDEMGSRVIKKTYDGSSVLSAITYYAGSVIYTQDVHVGGGTVAQEYTIVGGNGKIGIYNAISNDCFYEMTDQLGDVRSVILTDANGHYLDMLNYTDYYPYGMVLQQGGDNYRYGYQGQYAEKDDETNWNAFKLRMYDSRIGRWLSVDPYGADYSQYSAMGNDPANMVDPDGGDEKDPVAGQTMTKNGLEYTYNASTRTWDRYTANIDEFVGAPSRARFSYNTMTYEQMGAWIDKQRELGFTVDQVETFLKTKNLTNDAWRAFYRQSADNSLLYRQKVREGRQAEGEVAFFFYSEVVGFGVGEFVAAGVEAYRIHRLIKLARAAEKVTSAGSHLVYEGLDAAGVVRYVGITEREAAARFSEHLSAIGTGRELLNYRVIKGATGLTKMDARIWEQTLINNYGLAKNGGQLLNKINSIAPKYWILHGIQ
ncbi:hypothetical protein F5148DRAFT_1293014 [Russula earlei]|uniref:Uncharacterized protein n=1 Tax=Russula earlei TaxID=71964 RepID=A0ACC0TSW0_9AGAM|nr:hypothetical protein F5148DRAFT_1293014 [Russula earlei]